MCSPNTTSQTLYHQISQPAYASGKFLDILGYFPSQEVCPGQLYRAHAVLTECRDLLRRTHTAHRLPAAIRAAPVLAKASLSGVYTAFEWLPEACPTQRLR